MWAVCTRNLFCLGLCGEEWEVAPILLGGGVTFRRLSPVPTTGVEFFESVYPPNSMSNAHGELLRHEGYEVGTVTWLIVNP
jgi:hypothetical protein